MTSGSQSIITLASPVTIPDELLMPIPETADFRLKSLAQIRLDAAQAASGVGQQLEAQWLKAIDEISSARFVLDANRWFLGAAVFPAGAANVAGLVSLNLGACLLDATVVLQAAFEIAADVDAHVNGVAAQVRLSWRLWIDVVSAMPKMSIRLPSLGIHFPDFSLPGFQWQQSSPLAMTVFDMPLPTLPGIALKLTHDPVALTVTHNSADGALTVTAIIANAHLEAFGQSVALGSPVLDYQQGVLTVSGLVLVPAPLTFTTPVERVLPAPLDGLTVRLADGQLRLEIVPAQGMIKGALSGKLSIFPTAQPNKLLTLHLLLPFQGGTMVDAVTINGAPISRSIKLEVAAGALQALDVLFDGLGNPGSLSVNLGTASLKASDFEPLIEVLSAILAALARGLAGLARLIEQGLHALFALLRSAASKLANLEITVLLDANSGQLQQVLLCVHRSAGAERTLFDGAGCTLDVALDADLALLIDLRNGERDAYLVVTVDSGAEGDALLTLGTDLWFSSPDTDRGAGEINHAPTAKLISVSLKQKTGATSQRVSVIPFGIRHGEAVFFHALATPLPVLGTRPAIGFGAYQLVDAWDTLTTTATFPHLDTLGRYLPFLAVPGDSHPDTGLETLKQSIEIRKAPSTEVELKDGKFRLPLDVTIHLLEQHLDSQLLLSLDVRRMTADVTGGAIKLSMAPPAKFNLLGMQAEILSEKKGEQWVLDMRSADTRLYLNDGRRMVLSFITLGADANGRALEFVVSKLVVHGGGLDLDAELQQPFIIKLNGLGTEFTFDRAVLRVRSGRVEAFSLKALGKLPSDLLGEVQAHLQLDFGMRSEGGFGLLDGGLELKNKGKPIRSESTHFELTLDALSVRAFEDAGTLHFCAFISGTAQFKPQAEPLAEGMLKKLAGVTLSFTDCPLCGPSDVVARALEKLNLSFMVALDKPVRATLFEMFSFEVRSIGFEPRCRLFSPAAPALLIGGQISFSEADVTRFECDFHVLAIAPGEGHALPRVRCEGLGLALRLDRQLEIEGMVTAVDGRMPDYLLESRPASNDIKYNGFLGQGRVAIQGLPPFAASFGFVEVTNPTTSTVRRAWFVYLEAQRLSYYFQLGPVPLYLREAGLGLGYGFTYVGIDAVDKATSLQQMIRAMDDIAAHAVEPARVSSWTCTDDDNLTLVARVMISMSSASAPTETLVWKEEAEKELPNILLLNAVAAMRKGTFVMTSQVWLGYSYYDWDTQRKLARNELVGKQTMSGYVILAGARSEFLARLVSNPGAEIGPRLPLPEPFKNALKSTTYDATLYIRPGLLHFEMGWPDRIQWATEIAGVHLSVRGGAIFRVNEGAILVGMNLEGRLSAQMSARLDAGVIGVAVSASLEAALSARIIGYLDSQRVANSLYYSLFTLQVRLNFEVSAWLEVDAWLCKITIRISFAMSLQVDVISELALQGDLSPGTRVRASIAVSIFGRSLGLSIGLGFNPGLVDNAAARVGRFMNLGLIQEVPAVTPDIGQQDAANEDVAKLGQSRTDARINAGVANKGGSPLAPVPQEDPRPAQKTPTPKASLLIGATEFEIILSYPKVPPTAPLDIPLEGPLSGWVYLTFLPLEVFSTQPATQPARSSFYAAPRYRSPSSVEPDHRIHLPDSARGNTIYLYEPANGIWRSRQLGTKVDDRDIPTSVNWNAKLRYTQSTKEQKAVPADETESVDLVQLFFAAFRTDAENSDNVGPGTDYQEPNPRPPIQPAPSSPRTTEEQHQRQERAYSANIAQDPADRRCHEARDFLLQMFISDLFQLAADGQVPDTVHVVHLGLTLLVPLKLAKAIANASPTDTFVSKRIGQDAQGAKDSASCTMFNKPCLCFDNNVPRFERTRYKFEDNKALLDWHLSWDHPVDAEHFVQHYEVMRWIESAGPSWPETQPRTVKRADKVWHAEDESCRFVDRCAWQFTDEFDDLSSAQRKQLFDQSAVIRYTVVPVCVSGTRGVPCSDFIVEKTGRLPEVSIKRASAQWQVDPTVPGKADLSLRFESTVSSGMLPDDWSWRLVARSEPILPAGQYGTDSETQRALGQSIGAGRAVRPGDLIVDIPSSGALVYPPDGNANVDQDRHGSISALAIARDLMLQLKSTTDPRAFTLYVQVVMPNGNKTLPCSALVPVELSVILKGKAARPGEHNTVITRVDVLEMVRIPGADEKHLLDPVAGVNLHARAGQAAQLEPGTLTSNAMEGRRGLHPEYGALTELTWGLRPHGVTGAAARPYRLLSGFDVLSLDLDGGAQPQSARWQDQARRITSVRLLGEDSVLITPGELGETSNWKVRYPSQRQRRLTGGAWYSNAESRIEWPQSGIRREPLPEPPSELIKALLREGAPDYIELEMVADHESALVWAFKLPEQKQGGWSINDGLKAGSYQLTYIAGPKDGPDATNMARDLRLALRSLRAAPSGDAPDAGFSRKVLVGWTLNMTPTWRVAAVAVGEPQDNLYRLAAERIDMFYERDLHPLLEAILARMRRLKRASGERLLDLDRRPPPVADATDVPGFMAATAEVADPCGWTALDCLGLGVTLRLFDPVDDGFVSPDTLYEQLQGAIEQVRNARLFSDEQWAPLFIDVLLQPGGMMLREEFSARADHDGLFKKGGENNRLQASRLAMVHLSMRPVIGKKLEYSVFRVSAANASRNSAPGVDVCMPETGQFFTLDKSLYDNLNRLESDTVTTFGSLGGEYTVITRALKTDVGKPDTAPGKLGDHDDLPDAFGRFDTWSGWSDGSGGDSEYTSDITRFHTQLCNRLGLDIAAPVPPAKVDPAPIPVPNSDRVQIANQWLKWTERFFEFSSVPSVPAATGWQWPQYAFAALEAAEPVLVASDPAGCLRVTIPEVDGYAHLRAYALVPQWRYAKLLKAAGYTTVDEIRRESSAKIAGGSCYAIATVQRTAPIQPCALLPVARLGDSVWWSKDSVWEIEGKSQLTTKSRREDGWTRCGTDPGETLPMVVRTHAEARLSRANLIPARGLSFFGTLTSLVLTAADPQWCRFHQVTDLEPSLRPSLSLGNSPAQDLLDELAAMPSSPLVDAKVRFMRNLPHWYRHALLMSASAGSALADTVGAYVAEAPARLLEINAGVPSLKAGHPWHGLTFTVPIAAVGTPPYSGFSVEFPALRNCDTTCESTAAAWAGDIADLPDPEVAYDIELVAAAQPLRPRKVVTSLARISRSANLSTGPFQTFNLSKGWWVSCEFIAGRAPALAPLMRLTVSPMSKTVALNDALRVALQAFVHCHGSFMSVPGGWSVGWVNQMVAALGDADPRARMQQAIALSEAFANAGVGLPAVDYPSFENITHFVSFETRVLNVVRPTDPVANADLEAAFGAWIAKLQAHGSALAALVVSYLQERRPFADTSHLEPLAWLSYLPDPDPPLVLERQDGAVPRRLLIPDLMTDAQVRQITHDAPESLQALNSLRKIQRARTADEGALGVRATRGDVIPLELGLIDLL
jgi:hypothetical protein